MSNEHRFCCDGLCQQGRDCPSLLREEPPEPRHFSPLELIVLVIIVGLTFYGLSQGFPYTELLK